MVLRWCFDDGYVCKYMQTDLMKYVFLHVIN